ncbi:transcription antitermination factor NusB [Prochlorococcus sp. MIT 1341]|uniref:transcription antitermination factor NusB n=1 Tax=Prochlorococcus sp. MIT 1341 TaxID=3096221 RepID=UPI002A74EA62|nr:transcription antitermination factor NusB [Prochlorococcus sp. MIT 1341]
MQSRSFSRELSLLVLGQISESSIALDDHASLDLLIQKSIETLKQHWREVLDNCAIELETAQQNLVQTDPLESPSISIDETRKCLVNCLTEAEKLLNGLSASVEIPQLLVLSDQDEIRKGAIHRINLVLQNRNNIDHRLDQIMEGWRLKRLPRIDRDILRLACVDLMILKTPEAVACNEAVELANRYSDDQGRRMINGILRKFQDSVLSKGIK